MREYKINAWALPKIKQFRTYIDIGAHKGNTAIPYIEKFKRVYAFEPNPETNKFIPNSIKMFPYKLGDIEKETVLYADEGKKQFSVTQKTLDSFLFDNIDLIKVDVGNSELDVLMGSVNTIVRWHPVVIFRNDLVVDFFKELRYNIKKHDSDWIAWNE
tara:strand:+ start:770 stop:1243 length:474 start_codon:yes stop_codon:yes gene_type:complete